MLQVQLLSQQVIQGSSSHTWGDAAAEGLSLVTAAGAGSVPAVPVGSQPVRNVPVQAAQ